MVNWLLIVRDAQGLPGEEGRSVFAAVFVDQHVVVRECGLNTRLHWRTRTVHSGGEDQDQCGQASGRPAARHSDRHVRTGGVRPAGDKPRPAKPCNAHRKHAQGTVRAGVDKRGCGTCPLIARHVPELF